MDGWTTVVIEDQTLFRELLTKLLGNDPRYKLVGEASDGRSGLEVCRTARPHLVLLDIQIPCMDGFELAEKLFADLPETRVLALTALKDNRTISKVLESGFAGFVEKDQSLTVLEAAMAAVAKGGTFFTPGFDNARRQLSRDPNAFFKILSPREQEVLKLATAGYSSTQIARELGLSPRTAGNHRYNIMKKLDIHDVTGLVAFAIKNGFRSLE
jgi:DNA-binding NarL/FixJ family response regulator